MVSYKNIYRCVYTDGLECTHTFSCYQLRRPNILEATNHIDLSDLVFVSDFQYTGFCILVSSISSHQKEPGLLEEMAYSRDKTGNIQDEFEASYSTEEYENAKNHKDTHTHTNK